MGHRYKSFYKYINPNLLFGELIDQKHNNNKSDDDTKSNNNNKIKALHLIGRATQAQTHTRAHKSTYIPVYMMAAHMTACRIDIMFMYAGPRFTSDEWNYVLITLPMISMQYMLATV